MANEPVLIAPNFVKRFILSVDACDTGVGAVLQQDDDMNIRHPVSYFSRKLNKHEVNYSTIEKETLALLSALKHFDVYLSAVCEPTLVFTDHNPLVFLNRMKNKNQRLVRWSLILQEYNIVIHHVSGKDNIIADTLSRIA